MGRNGRTISIRGEYFESERRVEGRLHAASGRDVAVVADDLVGIPDRRRRAGVVHQTQRLDELAEHGLGGEFLGRSTGRPSMKRKTMQPVDFVGHEDLGTDANGRRESAGHDLVGSVDPEQVRVVTRDPHDDAFVTEVDHVVRVRDAVREDLDRAHASGPESAREFIARLQSSSEARSS